MSDTATTPLVSIGIPTYNRADSYLPQSLESALQQTYDNIEIIVSDNGSTDDTESLVKSYGDERVTYHKQDPALTPNDNFNFCLNASHGDLFLLLHDDDLIDPDFIELGVRARHKRPHVGVIRTGTRIVDGQGNVRKLKRNLTDGLSAEDFYLAWFAGKTSLYLPSTLFNRRALQRIGGFNSRHNLFQDVVAEVRLAADLGRVDIEDIKASFRVHDDELTFSASVKEWCEDSADLLDLMVRLAPEKKNDVRRHGEAFFAGLNYNRATHIKDATVRYRMYFDIYGRFNTRVSPVTYFCFRPVKRWVTKKLRQIERRLSRTPGSANWT